jgi:hypothetical protein
MSRLLIFGATVARPRSRQKSRNWNRRDRGKAKTHIVSTMPNTVIIHTAKWRLTPYLNGRQSSAENLTKWKLTLVRKMTKELKSLMAALVSLNCWKTNVYPQNNQFPSFCLSKNSRLIQPLIRYWLLVEVWGSIHATRLSPVHSWAGAHTRALKIFFLRCRISRQIGDLRDQLL